MDTVKHKLTALFCLGVLVLAGCATTTLNGKEVTIERVTIAKSKGYLPGDTQAASMGGNVANIAGHGTFTGGLVAGLALSAASVAMEKTEGMVDVFYTSDRGFSRYFRQKTTPEVLSLKPGERARFVVTDGDLLLVPAIIE